MNARFHRAQLLLHQHRYDLAEKELRAALAEDPGDSDGHAILAMCIAEQKRYDEATREAQEAVRLEPDSPLAHYALAAVYNDRDRLEEAERSIREAIRLDPEDADAHALLASLHLQRKRWQDAVDAAQAGLECDPEHVRCANLRAMALVKLRRRDEADATIQAALERDPDNALTHANQGWALLHANDPKRALEHFREALRLEPNMEWARLGIIEALKARNFVYRFMLRYFLWMSGLSSGAQWALIIGLWIGARVTRSIERSNPEWTLYLLPLQLGYLAFVLMTWIAKPLFNLMLRFDRFGRHALSRDEIRASNWVGGLLLCAAVMLVVALTTKNSTAILAAIYLAALIIPVSGTFAAEPGRRRNILALYTLALAALPVLGFVFLTVSSGLAAMTGGLFLIGILAFPWVANVMLMARARR
jgi:tetratricopeptide (TPR) repeat protein